MIATSRFLPRADLDGFFTALAADGWRWLAGLATRPGAAAAPTADAQPVKSNP